VLVFRFLEFRFKFGFGFAVSFKFSWLAVLGFRIFEGWTKCEVSCCFCGNVEVL